ncbi:MAG: hypothetical protein HC915_18190 [Anaerolineae bacterium]|nr:hypothetical protein [Anaerolineae bacterium]
MTLSRRDLLRGVGLGALGAGLVRLPGLRQAAAQTAPTQDAVAAYYRFRLGALDLIAISDSAFPLPITILAPTPPQKTSTPSLRACSSR